MMYFLYFSNGFLCRKKFEIYAQLHSHLYDFIYSFCIFPCFRTCFSLNELQSLVAHWILHLMMHLLFLSNAFWYGQNLEKYGESHSHLYDSIFSFRIFRTFLTPLPLWQPRIFIEHWILHRMMYFLYFSNGFLCRKKFEIYAQLHSHLYDFIYSFCIFPCFRTLFSLNELQSLVAHWILHLMMHLLFLSNAFWYGQNLEKYGESHSHLYDSIFSFLIFRTFLTPLPLWQPRIFIEHWILHPMMYFLFFSNGFLCRKKFEIYAQLHSYLYEFIYSFCIFPSFRTCFSPNELQSLVAHWILHLMMHLLFFSNAF